MKIAVIGSGISGLAVAHRLRGRADVTLYEAGSYFGGHTHTVDICLPVAGQGVTYGVDTGFLVFNARTYPNLIALFAELGVQTAASDMSFSVQVPAQSGQAALEWSGSSLNTVFAQRRNLYNLRFIRMLREVLRFNRLATGLALRNADAELGQPLAEFLRTHRFSQEFQDWYLLPMLGCIWSCPTDQMLQFPVATMVRFCHNHGLMQVRDRPQWWTVRGGARNYVEKIVSTIRDKRLNTPVQRIARAGADESAGLLVTALGQTEHFDKVVLATHSDQALALLDEPSSAQQAVLGAIRYQDNLAVLHTDASVLPKRRLAWAAWNYQQSTASAQTGPRVCLHYLLNRLQPLPFQTPVMVSLNPLQPIAPAQVLGTFHYAHPVFDGAAVRAQAMVSALQGQGGLYFCGAWTGYGFHEDGLKSALDVVARLAPWLHQ